VKRYVLRITRQGFYRGLYVTDTGAHTPDLNKARLYIRRAPENLAVGEYLPVKVTVELE
jgi:hypothetical protein